MAGLGFKTFTAGEILTAANVNGYLMSQSVMNFADSTARTSAIGTPTEGMLTYLADTNSFEYYDGAAYVALVDVSSVAGSAITGDITNATISAENVTPAIQTLGSATYTVADTDAQNTLVFTAATATVTFSTATAFSAGDRVDIVRDSADALTIAGGSGVVFAGKDTIGTAISFTIDTRYEAASVLCVGADEYRVIGAVTAV
jgi:hypothetical protein